VDIAEVIDLLSLNAAVLRDDVALMEAGILKCESFGTNVTREQAARLSANLARLDAIIQAELETGH